MALFLIMMAPDIIPHTKTGFAFYGEFREAIFNYFPDQLPDSAREIRYYIYTGKMDEISAVAFALDEEDYVLVRNQYKQSINVGFGRNERHDPLESCQKEKFMNRYKTIKSAVKKVILIVSILLITGWIWMAWELVLKHYIPFHKTHFRDYDAFYRKIGDNRFPREFPDTAEDPKYYFYTGQFDKMYGVSFIVGEEEFQELKETYFSEYTELAIEYETSESINYLFHEKLTDPFIQDEKITFVRELIREEEDHYSILAFERAENSDFVHRFGVFINDLTGEFIIFYFQDAFPQDPG